MKEILQRIYHSLSEEEKLKDIIVKDIDSEVNEMFDNDISIIEYGNTKKIHFAGIGQAESFNSKKLIVYRNFKKEIILKPIEIAEFLSAN